MATFAYVVMCSYTITKFHIGNVCTYTRIAPTAVAMLYIQRSSCVRIRRMDDAPIMRACDNVVELCTSSDWYRTAS